MLPANITSKTIQTSQEREEAGGFTEGGVTTSSIRAHARKVRYHKVYMARPFKHLKFSTSPVLSFGDEDCEGILYPNDDAFK